MHHKIVQQAVLRDGRVSASVAGSPASIAGVTVIVPQVCRRTLSKPVMRLMLMCSFMESATSADAVVIANPVRIEATETRRGRRRFIGVQFRFASLKGVESPVFLVVLDSISRSRFILPQGLYQTLRAWAVGQGDVGGRWNSSARRKS